MRRTLTLIAALSAVPAAAAAQGHDHASPYIDLRDREIKALSADDVEALLAGEGMGFALAAELNGYPGPKHVLELADSLDLTAEQRERTQAVMRAMTGEARDLGRRLVDAERVLDRAFATGTIQPTRLGESVEAIGALRGELRAVHLAAHLSMIEILTRHQRHVYQELRGYGVTHDHHDRETGEAAASTSGSRAGRSAFGEARSAKTTVDRRRLARSGPRRCGDLRA